MYFFITNKIDSTPSAIELAMIKRQQLFTKHRVPAMIVTRNYVRDLHQNMHQVGLDNEFVVNMYDYFQGTTDYEGQPMTAGRYPRVDGETLEKINPKQFDVIQREQRQKSIHLNPEGNVDYVDILNPQGAVSRRDYYDTRGFLSVAQYFDEHQNIVLEQHLTPQHQPVLETFFRPNAKGQPVATHQRLLGYHGATYEFEDWDQLTAFFLDCINTEFGGHGTMIVDRSDAGMHPLVEMNTTARKYEFLHSNFTLDPLDVVNSPIVPFTQIGLDHADQMDGFIMSTQAECDDMTNHIHNVIPTIAIPVGSVSDARLAAAPVKFSQRTPGKIVAVARLSVEKQLDQLIKAIAYVHEKLPQVTLDIYGYGDSWTGFKEEKRLRSLVTSQQWQSFINFKGFVHDLAPVYDQAQLMVLTSQYEGFNLGILEGLSHGVPVVAYDIKYGPGDMIEDGQNGRLIPANNLVELGKVILSLLRQPAQLERMSEKAYGRSSRYSEAMVWQKWNDRVVQPDIHAMRGVAAYGDKRSDIG
ncbi:glycosyltransferase [Lactiplantibacillus garii]|uniref:Glycosyltransferase n=1 Tax=Lactiplantibacillus garii TaxID=2306423 RepID=A0A426DAJ2_9LACO|nr:glycosyltransferase [Lactiplantibacillus garii]RRK11536.1 glycosyltransferase [Lactiplantibacillus garii]